MNLTYSLLANAGLIKISNKNNMPGRYFVFMLCQSNVKLTCRQDDIRPAPDFTQIGIDHAVKSSAWLGPHHNSTVISSLLLFANLKNLINIATKSLRLRSLSFESKHLINSSISK